MRLTRGDFWGHLASSGVYGSRWAAARIFSKRHPLPEIHKSELDIAELRAHLHKMTDAELLRFGRVAKYMCSKQAKLGMPQPDFVIQLREGREEWRRRFPKSLVDEEIADD